MSAWKLAKKFCEQAARTAINRQAQTQTNLPKKGAITGEAEQVIRRSRNSSWSWGWRHKQLRQGVWQNCWSSKYSFSASAAMLWRRCNYSQLQSTAAQLKLAVVCQQWAISAAEAALCSNGNYRSSGRQPHCNLAAFRSQADAIHSLNQPASQPSISATDCCSAGKSILKFTHTLTLIHINTHKYTYIYIFIQNSCWKSAARVKKLKK